MPVDANNGILQYDIPLSTHIKFKKNYRKSEISIKVRHILYVYNLNINVSEDGGRRINNQENSNDGRTAS